MRNPEEQQYALACLQLAASNWSGEQAPQIVADAERYFAFVTGSDTDDAKAKLAAVRDAVT